MTLDEQVNSYGILLTEEERDEVGIKLEELLRFGFTTIESGLSVNDLDDIRKKLADVYARQLEEIGGSVTLEASHDADVARCLLAYETCFFDLATNKPLLGFCRRLFGDNFVLLQQNGLMNHPVRSHYQLRWHRDLPFQHWVCSMPIAISALLCVDEFNATTGGTYVLAGSHLHEKFPSDAFVRRHQQVMDAHPGTFILMDAMVFHRAGKNSSTSVRRAVNHLIGRPFLAQQIDIPRMLGSTHAHDPAVSNYLGYQWGPAASVTAWRKHRSKRKVT